MARRHKARALDSARWGIPALIGLVVMLTLAWRAFRSNAAAQGNGRKASQRPEQGVGKLYHRRYWVNIVHPRVSATTLMRMIQHDIRRFAPVTLAKFTKTRGGRAMRVGDEYRIEIAGPWNGSVRATDVKPNSFTFVTLEGHPEAGEIEFNVHPSSDVSGALCFEINSHATCRDMLVNLAYDAAGIGKELQKSAWTQFCEEVVAASGGTLHGEINVISEEEPREQAAS